MTSFWLLTKINFLILVRNKQALYFGLLLPVVVVAVFGWIGDSFQMAGGISYADYVVPGLMALLLMQMTVLSVAFFIVQQRERGVFKKLLTTPMTQWELVAAQIASRVVFMTLQLMLVVSIAVLILSFVVHGSFAALIAVGILGSLTFLALGFVVAGLARSIESVPVIANLIILPLLLLGDVFFPIALFPEWIESLAQLLPIQHLTHALREIMLNGASFWSLQNSLLGLLTWLVLFFALAVRVFKLK